jgi:ABC-type amino acid transport substrate-binding protein
VAFDKNSSLPNDTLVTKVNEILAEMRSDGTLHDLSMKWFNEDLTVDPTQ